MESNISALPLGEDEWIIDKSLDDEHIRYYGEPILKAPSVCVQKNDGNDEMFYSYQQMLEMFRLGYITMSRTIEGRKVLKEKKLKWLRPYEVLRKMDVGNFTTFPFEKWGAVRSAASVLKRQFGSTFRVIKKAPTGKVGDIEVRRLS